MAGADQYTGLGGVHQPEREVSEEDIQEFTKRTGLTVFEASAKSGYGVESSFIALTEALVDEEESQPRGSSIWGGLNGSVKGSGYEREGSGSTSMVQ